MLARIGLWSFGIIGLGTFMMVAEPGCSYSIGFLGVYWVGVLVIAVVDLLSGYLWS